MGSRRRFTHVIVPSLSAQQLDRHPITGVQTFHFNRYVDQAIGLYHGREYPGALVAGCPDLEQSVLTCEDPAEEMSPIRPLGKFFLKDCFHNRPGVAAASAHFENGGPNQLLEGDHGRNRIPRKPKGQFVLDLPEGQRLPRPNGKFPEIHLCSDRSKDRLSKVVITHRNSA